MFERYTEKARRVIFVARYEASRFGSQQIEPEHLLLGVLSESHALTERSQRPDVSWALLVRHKELIRKQIEETYDDSGVDLNFRRHASERRTQRCAWYSENRDHVKRFSVTAHRVP